MEADYDIGQLRYIKSAFLTVLAHFSVTPLHILTPPWTKIVQKTTISLYCTWAGYAFTRHLTFNQRSLYRHPLRALFLLKEKKEKERILQKEKLRGDRIGLDACHLFFAVCRLRRGAAQIRETGSNGIKCVKNKLRKGRKSCVFCCPRIVMPRYNFLLCLMVLISLGQSGSDEPNLLLPPASETPTDAGLSLLDEDAGSHECSACVWREQSKVLRLETIKSQILSKLRLKQAPNISREVVNQLLPKAPPLQQLLDHHDFQGDASSQDEFMEEDEYHATTESVITMASERE